MFREIYKNRMGGLTWEGCLLGKKSNKSERVTPSAQKMVFLLEREKKGEKEEREKKKKVL